MKKTVYERFYEAMHKGYENQNDVDKVISYAYEMGRHHAAREVSDRATEKFKEILKRADECRYYKMAHKVAGDFDPFTGNSGFVYSSDYSGDYVYTCGDEMVDVE